MTINITSLKLNFIERQKKVVQFLENFQAFQKKQLIQRGN